MASLPSAAIRQNAAVADGGAAAVAAAPHDQTSPSLCVSVAGWSP